MWTISLQDREQAYWEEVMQIHLLFVQDYLVLYLQCLSSFLCSLYMLCYTVLCALVSFRLNKVVKFLPPAVTSL